MSVASLWGVKNLEDEKDSYILLEIKHARLDQWSEDLGPQIALDSLDWVHIRLACTVIYYMQLKKCCQAHLYLADSTH